MPVFASDMTQRGSEIGRRIREERRRLQLTLREVADRVDMSTAKLSNIETGKVSLTLDELTDLAQALGVGLPTLIPRTRLEYYYMTRAADLTAQPPTIRELVGPEPGPAVDHNRVWELADPFVGKQIEPVLTSVEPLADRHVHFISHDHEEFVFVLAGEIEIQIKTNDGLLTERLGAGDALYFRSNLPHCMRSTTATSAQTLNVAYPLRSVDPHDYELGSGARRYYRRGAHAGATKEASEKLGLLRRRAGLTLAELAANLGIGARQLAQIEAGQRPPDFELVMRLARHFRRPLEYFLATTLDSQPYYIVQQRDAIMTVPVRQRKTVDREGGTSPNIFRPLAAGFPERGMHPYYLQVTATSDRASAPHEHHGQEFIYVLAGEVEFLSYDGDEVTEVLRPGDSLFLESSVPHRLRGASRNPYASTSAEVIDVFWSPLGEDYLFSR